MSKDADELLDGILNTMAAANIPSHIAKRDGPLLLMNQSGTRPPLIWCFNRWSEALLLGKTLGADQPLIAMISLSAFKMPKARKAWIYPALIKTFTELVDAYVREEPFVVGGNCEAGWVAEGMAHRMFFAKMRCPLLILLDHVPVYAYPGSLLMLFGTKSHLNPFAKGHKLEGKWQVFHGAPRWGFIDAEHGHFFVRPGLSQLSQHVKLVVKAFNADGQISTGLQELKE